MLAMTRRMSQLMGLLILVSMIFVLLSVGSYSLDDPAWNYYTSREVINIENLGGRAGAFLADWGLQLFGSTVFVFIACTALGSICLMRARVRSIIGAAWRGLLLIVSASTLAHLYWLDDPFFEAGLLAGGASGQWLAEFLVPYLKLPGTYTVAGLSVLWVLLTCTRLSLFKGVRQMAGAVKSTRERHESDELFSFDEDLDLDPRSDPSGLQDDDERGAFIDEAIDEKSGRAAVPRVRRLATESSVADPSMERAVPSASRVSRISKPPSFLAQRAKKSQQPSQLIARNTDSQEYGQEEGPRVEQPAPKGSISGGDTQQAASPETRPSEVPVLPSFRAKYVMDLQRSIQKPPRGAVPEDRNGEEMPGVEPPAPEDRAADSVMDEATPAAPRASKIPKSPSLRAQRVTAPPRIIEALPGESMSGEVAREGAPLVERAAPEDSAADSNTGQVALSQAHAPQVPILQPLPVKHVTLSQQAQLPSLDLLDTPSHTEEGQNEEELLEQASFLEQKLREFGVEGEVVQVSPGPVITMYEFAPAAGVKVNKIANLQDDLALVMRALSVRIVAPVPGKAVVGIEVPNVRRETIALRSLVDSEEFQGSSSKLSIVLGKDILGQPVITDLALIPHLLVAGATGSGKSVGLNSVICSLLFRVTPAEVKLIMIDPKMLEFAIYDGIPHLLVPVVTDAKKAAVALRRVVAEMERRYQLLAAKGVRSIAQYNQKIRDEQAGERDGADSENPSAPAEMLPYLVVVVDELSDLMMVSSREVEDSLMRIAQMARAAGIHLIVATQRPSVDVLTGVIKANFPARLSFQVTSKTDSRTILDANGAETLLGRGDMLFLAPGTSKPQRVHGAYVSEAEITRLVEAWKGIEAPSYNDSFLEPISEQVDDEDSEYDEKYDEAIALVARTGQASISMLQRRLRVGYNRAARMIEVMEKEGVVGPADGVKPREVLVRDTYDEV